MEHDHIIALLEKNRILKGLTPQQLTTLCQSAQEVLVNPGELIIQQDEPGDDMYIILSGLVEVIKHDNFHADVYHRINTLGPNNSFGELGLVEHSNRSASVRALEVTHLLRLTSTNFQQLIKDEKIKTTFYENLIKYLGDALRQTNSLTVESLRRELKAAHNHIIMGNFMVGILVLLSLYTLLMSSLAQLIKQLGAGTLVTIPISLVMLGLFFIGVKSSGYPLSFYGITIKHWKRSLMEGICFTLPILLTIVLLKWIAIETNLGFHEEPLFNLKAAVTSKTVSQVTIIWMAIFYMGFSVPIQELIVRGGLQGSLQAFLTGKYRALIAIFASNLIFAIVHLSLSHKLAYSVFLLGLFWGWLYYRHRNLLGVIVSHLLIGTWAFFFVGVQPYLIANG